MSATRKPTAADRENALWQGEILAEVAGTLDALGCRHGLHDAGHTPPMMYREWLLCCVGKREDEKRALVEALEKIDTWLRYQPLDSLSKMEMLRETSDALHIVRGETS